MAADAQAADLGPMARELHEHGLSLHAIAAELAARSVATLRATRGRLTEFCRTCSAPRPVPSGAGLLALPRRGLGQRRC